jgi:hypothetical protein
MAKRQGSHDKGHQTRGVGSEAVKAAEAKRAGADAGR